MTSSEKRDLFHAKAMEIEEKHPDLFKGSHISKYYELSTMQSPQGMIFANEPPDYIRGALLDLYHSIF
jgi:hypothetical protein